jgi:lipopolysaccharide O-acetyltransferase
MRIKIFIKKICAIIVSKGFIFLIQMLLKKVFFFVYERKFKESNGIFLKHGFMVSGHKFISLGKNFRAGSSLRLEAICEFSGQTFEPIITIGDNVFINDNVHIGCVNHIQIGNDVLFASKIFITDHNHGYYGSNDIDLHESPEVPPAKRILSSNGTVIIDDNVWLGEAVTILPGSHIGRGSIIGANSVVNGVIPPYSIAVGSPAVVIKQYSRVKQAWMSVSERCARDSA